MVAENVGVFAMHYGRHTQCILFLMLNILKEMTRRMRGDIFLDSGGG